MKIETNYYIETNIINMEELKRDAEEVLNHELCDVGTFYVDIETYNIYLTPLGYITKKVFYSTPFRSRDEKAILIKVGKLIPELPAIMICIPIKSAYRNRLAK